MHLFSSTTVAPHPRHLAASIFTCSSVNVLRRSRKLSFLVKFRKLPQVAPQRQGMPFMHEPVDGFTALFARCDGVDGKLRSRVDVAAHEDIRLCRLVCHRIRLGRPVGIEFHCRAFQESAPLDGLADGQEYIFARYGHALVLIIYRCEPALRIKYGCALFKNNVTSYIVAPTIPDGMRELASLHPEVPYAFIDSSLPDLSPFWGFAQDPVAAGRTGARLMCLSHEPLERVIALQTHKGAFNEEMRAKAFTAALSSFSPETVVDSICLEDGEEMETVLRKVLGKAASFGIFIVNDQAAILCKLLEKMGVLEKARIIGFDLSVENRKHLQNGEIFSIIGQRPRTQGHDAVMAMFNHFTLSAANGNLSAPVDIYIKENIPESEHWL